jgi:NTP pyrophosphatase (non-canonical NTP hydrolase)
MSSISLDSTLDEDHLRYAVVEWEWVWFDWVSNVPKPDGAMLSAMFQKLLEIDLMSCFSHAFTCRHLEEVVYEARLSFDTLVKGYGNPLIPSNLLLYDIDSNPLAQPAVTHVRACCEAAILHLLDAYHPYTNHYNPSFYFLTFLSIHNLIPGEVPAEAWNSKKVVCALKRLKQGSMEHFHELTGELRGKVTNIADILDIDMEDIETAIASI